jgi:hypothetical protein
MKRIHAFIDEAGDRSMRATASAHFVLSAVMMREESIPAAAERQASLRASLNRQPGDPLHFQNFKQHAQRLHAAQTIGTMPELRVASVVVCKRHFQKGQRLPDEHHNYLFTFRMLLERLSWFARSKESELSFTLAHIARFKLAQLRGYEAALRSSDTGIEWGWLDPAGGKINQPNRIEQLQLADIAASATFQAFEPDEFGNTEPRYLRELAPRLYRNGEKANRLTSYGLKLHPTRSLSAYPFVADLT